ncbi:MAG: MotA/TolQ/ExbB proton channel family protein [Deltaproteobacteria bacterium]|nr:MotA/TolQ/ExbB proton channel family protein [Deltaproteobacteria bacterium]MBW2499046.1 MotA/TolQ/ExbB proton channel family protein [Deltaproteobacteria bacterium]
MEQTCPYCDAGELEWSDEGALWRCRACGRSSLPAGSAAGTGPSETGEAPSTAAELGSEAPRPPTRSAPGEVPNWPPAAMGLAVTAVFYAGLWLFPGSALAELFANRGWVPYVITAISAWALSLLASRLRRLRLEASVLEHSLIPATESGRLRPGDAEGALASLRAQPAAVAESFLARRLERALQHFESRRRVVEVVEYLASESRTDDARVDASYSLVRVFVWVVPTLGFIGTVIGIGAAVGGFSETLEAASSLDAMKESIGSVTGGLGVAFDTTLLALVMSIVIMFPANAVQRVEEGLLGSIDEYCSEHLVQRLEDEGGDEADSPLIEALAARLVEAMKQGGAWPDGEPG